MARPLAAFGVATLRRLKRFGLVALVGVALTGASVGGYAGYLQLTGNIHEVVAGEFYRSAQPTPAMMSELVATQGIKTVINLRGANPGSRWYREEVAESDRLGLIHIDFRMRANRPLSAEDSKRLLAILERAPKPILVHCRSGADRSGLVSALYLAGVKKFDEESAEAQLSIAFGHFPIPATPAYAMDDTFEALEPSLGFLGS